MSNIPYFNDRLEIDFHLGGKHGNLIILPVRLEGSDKFPFKGEYIVFYHHPFYRSTSFIIEDANRNWLCGFHPPYISQEFIKWIGKQIEKIGNLIGSMR